LDVLAIGRGLAVSASARDNISVDAARTGNITGVSGARKAIITIDRVRDTIAIDAGVDGTGIISRAGLVGIGADSISAAGDDALVLRAADRGLDTPGR
jgi:hypothetical protein